MISLAVFHHEWQFDVDICSRTMHIQHDDLQSNYYRPISGPLIFVKGGEFCVCRSGSNLFCGACCLHV
jgi:hypothetical protein